MRPLRTAVTPSDMVVRRMKDRANRLCGLPIETPDPPAGSARAEIARALIEAWSEGVIAEQMAEPDPSIPLAWEYKR